MLEVTNWVGIVQGQTVPSISVLSANIEGNESYPTCTDIDKDAVSLDADLEDANDSN